MDDIFLLAGFIMIFAFILFFSIWIFKITKKQRKEMKNEPQKVINLDEPCDEPDEYFVKVINQTCSAKLIGTKQPKAINEFIITFETTDGEIIKLSVPQECYAGFEIGQSGKLKIINGELYSFEI